MSLIQPFYIILLIISLGIICHKLKMLNTVQTEGLEIILFKILTPCYLFNSIIQQDLGVLLYLPYIYSYLISFVFIVILILLAFYKNSSAALYIKILASGYVNTAIYALPIITFLLENPMSAILSNLLQVIIIQSVFITLISFAVNKKESIIMRLMTLISTPLIIMPVLGLLCNYMQVVVNPIIIQITQTLGNGVSSMALFTFGLTLGGTNLNKNDINKHLLLIVLIKNVAHPIIAFCIGKYIFHLSQYWLNSLVIVASAPTAYIVYLISKHFSVETELVKKTVAVSSITSLISLVIIILILR